MAARAPRQSLMTLWKRGWNEIPEVMGSSVFALMGYIGIPIILYNWTVKDKGNHRYKPYYIVYRPDDPRAKRIRRFEDSPPPTSGGKC